MVKTSKIIATLGVAAGLGVALMPLASYADEAKKTVEVEVSPYFEFAVTGYIAKTQVSGDTNTTKINMDRNDTDETIEHKITANGNTNKGYTLTMVANHSALVGELTSKEIPSIASTATALPTSGSLAEHTSTNYTHGWGYRFTENAAAASEDLLGNYSGKNYNDIPTGTADNLGHTALTENNYIDNPYADTVYVNYGIVTATDEIADTYKAEITYTATPSPALN